MTKKTIATLLTCHNRSQKTLKCLHSLFEASIPEDYKIDVFLTDDGSTDGTAEAVNEKFPSVNVIRGTGSLYWNRGMHLAWESAVNKASYDYYLWLNDDVILIEHALATMLNASIKKPNSIICGSTCSKDLKTVTYGGFNKKSELIRPNGRIQACTKFNGNIVLIPVSVYLKAGNLDPKYPHAIGDYDYAYRAIEFGFENYIAPDFLGICEIHTSLPQWCLPEVPLTQRVKVLYSPLGNSHPYFYFYYERKHYGISTAIKHFFTIHIRLLFPRLWKLKKN